MDRLPLNRTDDEANDVVARALALAKQAQELRADAITKLLERRERIENDLRTLGYTGATAKNGATNGRINGGSGNGHHAIQPRRFKGLTLAAVAKTLITENGALHGSKIEELAKAGGFKGGTQNFQNYLPVALKRDGGFVNIGKNTWDLKKAD